MAVSMTGSFPSSPKVEQDLVEHLDPGRDRRGQLGDEVAVGVSRSMTARRGDPLAVAERLGDFDEGEDPLAGAGMQVVHRCQYRLLVQLHQLRVA